MPNSSPIVKSTLELPQDKRIDLVIALIDSLDSSGRSHVQEKLRTQNSKTESDSNKAYPIAKVARMLNVSSKTVSKWFDSGKLSGYRTCSTTVARIKFENLEKFLTAKGLSEKIPRNPENKKLAYTTGQVAKIVGVTSKTVLRWARSGKLKAYFIAGNQERRIPHGSVVKFANDTGRKLRKVA